MEMKLKGINFSEAQDLVSLDGNPMFAVKYESTHSKLFLSYHSLKMSLDECSLSIDYINRYRDKQDQADIRQCVLAHYRSLIVNYGRCFVQGRVKIERKMVPKELLEFHDETMAARHKQIAHSGGGHEISMNIIALYPNFNEKRIVDVLQPQFFEHQAFNPDRLNNLNKIIESLLEFILKKMQFHYKALSDEIRQMDIDKLYEPLEKFNLEEHCYSPKIVESDRRKYPVKVEPSGKVTFKGISLREVK